MEITGTVQHNWNDTYDFDDGQPGFEEAKLLLDEGMAKEFSIRANWRQKVTATYRLENGELKLEGTKWEDIDDAGKEKPD